MDPKLPENLMSYENACESDVLHIIEQRFNKRRIYTNAGDLLIFVNPNEKYPIYCDRISEMYRNGRPVESHVFGVVKSAFNAIKEGSSAESIIMSGESGSGKSHNFNQVLRYLATAENSKISSAIINAITKILHSFTAARTNKNDEATRCGISADILYKKESLEGVNFQLTMPLEAIRVSSQRLGERNYNVFYEISCGLPAEEMTNYGIREGQKFFYTTQGKTDPCTSDSKNFKDLDIAFGSVGINDEQKKTVYKVIIAILHIGNLYFRQKHMGTENQVEIGNENALKWAAYLLGVDYNEWRSLFVQKIVKTDDETIVTHFNMEQALDFRDGLAQTLYEELLNWIVSRINTHFKCPNPNAVISVLDHYGFEKYNNNGLEQLLINAANEKMENLFIKQMLYEQMDNYIREGIHVPVEVPQHLDNSKTVDALFKKPSGLLPLLDDECKFPKSSDHSYLQHCNLNHLDKGLYGKARSKEKLEFSLKHYGGSTWYTVSEFLYRNRRAVPFGMIKALANSQNSVIAMLFRSLVSAQERDYIVYSAHKMCAAMTVLAEKIVNGNSHYVRCMRANNQRAPASFDLTTVSRQLRALAVAEVLTFRLQGFPVRIPFLKFAQSYRCLLPSDITECHKQKEIIADVLESQGHKFVSDYKIGRNYVFLRERLANCLEDSREKTIKSAALIVQKTMRSYVKRKQFLRKKKAVIKLQAGLRGWKARKQTSALREELFKKLGKQSRRARRLEAYYDGLKDPTNEPTPSTVTDYIDISEQIDVSPKQKKEEKSSQTSDFETTTNYLCDPKKKPVLIEELSMEEFSAQFYRGHLLEVRREPIMTPFLHKDNDLDFQLSTEIFKLILKYSTETRLPKIQLEQLERYIIQQGNINCNQRDEIYVQLCNQGYRNKDKTAMERCFRMLVLCAATFPPSEEILPLLAWYSRTMPLALRNQLMENIQRRLRVRGLLRSRLHAPSEIEQTNPAQPMVLSVICPDGEEVLVETHSWMSNADIANAILRNRGVGNPRGWTVELESDRIYSSCGPHFVHDVISEAQFDENEKQQSYFLNFSSERTLPPMSKKKEAKANRSRRDDSVIRSPPSDRREFSPAGLRRNPVEDVDVSQEYVEENPYCYTLPKKKHSKDVLSDENTDEELSRVPVYDRVYQYPQTPIIQYVPVMMPMNQPMMTPMVPPGYRIVPMAQEADMANNRPSTRASVKDFGTMRSVGSKQDYNPSDYSNLSIASRIRRMPIPENYGDVDHFLDQVFNQVLPPEELQKLDNITSKDIAETIKGGANGPAVMDQSYERVPSHTYDTMNFSSDAYDYVDRDRMAQRNAQNRSRSLPRTSHERALNVSQRSNGYTQITDVPPTPQQYHRRNQRSIDLPSTPVPPIPPQSYKQPMFMMMPVQVNEDGQMIPMMMSPNQPFGYPKMQFMQYPQQIENSLPRDRSRDEERQRNFSRRSVTPSGRYEQDLHMRASLQPYRQPSVHDPIPRLNGLASPVKSPTVERKGLNRVPVEQYADPIVQNSVSNSEHLNPNKIHVPEKELYQRQKEKESEAVRKLNEKLKRLPPPVDKVRVFLPPKPAPPPAPTPKKEIPIPDEPSWIDPSYFPRQPTPPPQPPAPVHVPIYVQPEMPREEWVFEGDVERPPEFQKRIKSAKNGSLPQPSPAVSRKVKEEKPAVKYAKQPWRLTIRKEMFYPSERLDDVKIIDKVFAQIITDCRRAIAYRIRAYEREDVVDILKENNIPPDMLNHQNEIPTSVKVEVIDAARRWPLYFSQIYEAAEERMDETVSVLLAISEHGVRLLMHVPQDKEDPLKVQDQFQFHDILEVTVESEEYVCIHTRSQMIIRVRTLMAAQIAEEINKCLHGYIKKRSFVRAVSDFATSDPSMLSFAVGDIIELVDRPDGEEIQGNWLYGKIGNHFGNFGAQYVVPMNDGDSPPPPLSHIPPVTNGHNGHNGHLHHPDAETNNGELHSLNGFMDEEFLPHRTSDEKYTMMEFAMKNFRVPKNSDRRTRNGNWTWQDVAQLVKYSDKPITHSLLRIESGELDRLAADAFLCVMRYMGDQPMKRGDTLTDIVYRLLIICKKNDLMKDEVYCQIVKQTTNNKSNKPNSTIHGWRLFAILTAYFECSAALKPYLLSYLADNADDTRRAYHGTAQHCLINLNQTFQYGGRKCLLSGKEVEEITNGKVLKRQVYLMPGGHKKVINTKSVTVVEEVIREMCEELNVLTPSEQLEFSLCCVHEKDDMIEYLTNDEYILDVTTSLDHKKIPFHFMLRRSVWIHPLRMDNMIYIDVLFFQVLPEYLLGSYIENTTGALSAAMTEDVIQLAALLHIAANEGRMSRVNGKMIQSLVPVTVLDLKVMTHDSWAERINRRLPMHDNLSPLRARTSFIELLSKWPLFGVTSFSLENSTVDGRTLPDLNLTVGRKGITLLQPLSHRIFDEWGFDKVRSVELKKTTVLIMLVETGNSEQIYEFKTKEAPAIDRLIAQYKFVIRESEAVIVA